MASTDYVKGLKKRIVRDLNKLSHLIGRFHHMIHGGPVGAPHKLLGPLASVYWAADLAETLASNTSELRDHLIIVEPIRENKDPWPEGDPIDDPKVSDDDLWKTIQMMVSMELATFHAMTDQYEKFAMFKWKRKPRRTIHDLLHEILLNTNKFIAASNKKEPLKKDPVKFEDPPKPPSPLPGPERPALLKLEHEIRRYIEVHMQIATFIPTHLRNATTKKFR